MSRRTRSLNRTRIISRQTASAGVGSGRAERRQERRGKPAWLYRVIDPVDGFLSENYIVTGEHTRRRSVFALVLGAWWISAYFVGVSAPSAFRWIQAGYKH